MRHLKNEDLNGYIRGAHKGGPEICDGYEFHLPGSSSTPDKVIWGWNDIASFDCEKCKLPAEDHIVLRAPTPIVIKPDKKDTLRRDTVQPAVSFDPTAADPANESEKRKQREAEQAAYFNSGYDPTGMLDDENDPLAIVAKPKPKPPPPPPPPASVPVMPAQPVTAAKAPPATFTAIGADLVEGVQDPALQELLSRDASANEAFKREVERMVREANQQQASNEPSGAPPVPTGRGVAESKDLAGCTVPLGTFADAGALLQSVALERYETAFNEEAMDPDTLIEVLEQQGKSALDEALKELGIKSMGHRLKIVNALIIQ